jgi:hypothetical protein
MTFLYRRPPMKPMTCPKCGNAVQHTTEEFYQMMPEYQGIVLERCLPCEITRVQGDPYWLSTSRDNPETNLTILRKRANLVAAGTAGEIPPSEMPDELGGIYGRRLVGLRSAS